MRCLSSASRFIASDTRHARGVQSAAIDRLLAEKAALRLELQSVSGEYFRPRQTAAVAVYACQRAPGCPECVLTHRGLPGGTAALAAERLDSARSRTQWGAHQAALEESARASSAKADGLAQELQTAHRLQARAKADFGACARAPVRPCIRAVRAWCVVICCCLRILPRCIVRADGTGGRWHQGAATLLSFSQCLKPSRLRCSQTGSKWSWPSSELPLQ